jgi:hypothetical protein
MVNRPSIHEVWNCPDAPHGAGQRVCQWNRFQPGERRDGRVGRLFHVLSSYAAAVVSPPLSRPDTYSS